MSSAVSTSNRDEVGRTSDEEALNWILGFADPLRGVGWNAKSSNAPEWKLKRTSVLLDLLGRPDHSLQFATIAGTNGKGSTGAILSSVASAHGYLVGHFAQPHLHLFRERIQIGGRPISVERFNALVAQLRSAVGTLLAEFPTAGEPTAFELSVVLGLLAFAEAGVDLAIMEVGLGGRLDPVNVLEPIASIITSIGYDHIGILGHTLGAIAREKSGIMRRDRPIFSAIQRPSAARTLRQSARKTGANLHFVEPLRADPAAPPLMDSVNHDHGQSVLLPDDSAAKLGLLGDHQRQNAALVLAIWDVLFQAVQQVSKTDGSKTTGRSGPEPAHTRAISLGLANVIWPGRLEWVAGDPAFLLDGAHNPAGATALASSVETVLGPSGYHLIFGCARDKDIAAVLGPLLRSAHTVYISTAPDPRAASVQELARVARRLGRGAIAQQSVSEAIAAAQSTGDRVTPVLVAGSLALVAAARVALGLTSIASVDEPVIA